MKVDKTFKRLSISISILVLLSACSLISSSGLQTSSPVNTVPSMTLQSGSTQTETNAITSTSAEPTITASPTSTTTATATSTTTITSTATSIPPVTLNWQAYSYACELATGGTVMTIELSWSDISNSEDGFRVYRDNIVIATLAANTTTYVDVVFIATGNTVSHSIEIFNADWQVTSSTIVNSCQ